MKNLYTKKTILTLMFSVFTVIMAHTQVRLKLVNPANGSVTLHNYGSGTVNVSTYWLCNFPNYNQLNSIPVTQGNLNLAPGAEVTVTSSIGLSVADSEVGLYNSSSFASSVAMQDYVQWGFAGHEREAVAVNKGIWTAGTFVSATPPLEYLGNGSQNGAQFWGTTLGIDEFENDLKFTIVPNPIEDILRLNFKRVVIDGRIDVYNILGRLMITKQLSTTETVQMDVSGFSQGMYLIKITADTGSQTRRFIKK